MVDDLESCTLSRTITPRGRRLLCLLQPMSSVTAVSDGVWTKKEYKRKVDPTTKSPETDSKKDIGPVRQALAQRRRRQHMHRSPPRPTNIVDDGHIARLLRQANILHLVSDPSTDAAGQAL